MNDRHRQFFATTHSAWRNGQIGPVSDWVIFFDARAEFDKWLETTDACRAPALLAHLDAFPPLPDEFLVKLRERRGEVTLLATNQRLWLREHRSLKLIELQLADLAKFSSSWRFNHRVAHVRKKDGTALRLLVKTAPPDRSMRELIAGLPQADWRIAKVPLLLPRIDARGHELAWTDDEIVKLGCLAEVTDYRFTGTGEAWKEHYAIHRVAVRRPLNYKAVIEVRCPRCSQRVAIQVTSNRRVRIKLTVAGVALVATMAFSWAVGHPMPLLLPGLVIVYYLTTPRARKYRMLAGQHQLFDGKEILR